MKIVINEYIDLVWKDNRPMIYVAGKEFITCTFLVTQIPEDKAAGINSVDDLTTFREAHTLHDLDQTKFGMSIEDVMQAHASNLIAWAENGYNSRILHSNLSFPLLKELTRLGDAKAARVYEGELHDRIKDGSFNTITVILATSADHLDSESWKIVLAARDANKEKWSKMFLDDHILRSFWNGTFPIELLGALVEGYYDATLFKSISTSNKITDEAARKIYARSKSIGVESMYIKGYLASNKSVPVDILIKLSNEPNLNMNTKIELAMNISFPIEKVDSLLKSFTVQDTGIIFRTIRTRIENHVAKRDDEWARSSRVMAMFYIHSIVNGISFSYGLFQSPMDYAAGFLKEQEWQFLLDTYRKNESFKLLVAVNDETPSWVLSSISKHSKANVRRLIAGNKNVGQETLYELSDDDNYEVRLAVAMNKNSPISVLRVLSTDWNDEVSYAARVSLGEGARCKTKG